MFVVRRIIVVFIASTAFLGCKEEHPNPELLDPIYMDLSSDHKNFSDHVKEHTKQIQTFDEIIDGLSVGDKDKPRFIADQDKAKRELKGYKQKVRYLAIRKERRRVEARKAYKLSLQNGTEWPNQKEYERYLTNKRLRNANLDWGERVPSLTIRYMPKPKPKIVLEEKKEAKK